MKEKGNKDGRLLRSSFALGRNRLLGMLFVLSVGTSLFILFGPQAPPSTEPIRDASSEASSSKETSASSTQSEPLRKAERELSVPSSARSGSAAELLAPEEFVAIVSGSKSQDVLVRNNTLNHFKMLARNDANLAAIRTSLLELDATDEAFAPLAAALAAVGTPGVQRILREVVDGRERDWRTFSAIVPVLGLLESPTPETFDFLTSRSRDSDQDFSSTAALALGSIVHTLSKTDSRKGEILLKSYIDKLENSNGQLEELKESLAVLGNAGLPGTEPALLKWAADPRPDVRAEAVMALRFLRTVEVEDVLLARFADDPDLEVRLRAVDALTHGPISDRVLRKAMQLLDSKKKPPPELREKILDLFSHSELSSERSKATADWLTKFSSTENEPAVRSKVGYIIKELLRPK